MPISNIIMSVKVKIMSFLDTVNWLSDRDPKSFDHNINIHLSFGKLQEVLQWCKSNVEYNWGWQPIDRFQPSIISGTFDAVDGVYSFYFDNSKDATAFTLRWSN